MCFVYRHCDDWCHIGRCIKKSAIRVETVTHTFLNLLSTSVSIPNFFGIVTLVACKHRYSCPFSLTIYIDPYHVSSLELHLFSSRYGDSNDFVFYRDRGEPVLANQTVASGSIRSGRRSPDLKLEGVLIVTE